MDLNVFGGVHIIYLLTTFSVSAVGLYFAKKYAKTERSQSIVLKSIAALLLICLVTNRLSLVFRYSTVQWERIIPDSFCGMTSLVLSLSVLFGKRDNAVYHFVWSLGIVGSLVTIFYPTFLNQSTSIFYLPTISGLLHHSVTLVMISALFMFKQIYVTYKKWYCTLFGFTAYLTVGAFQMSVFGYEDAFHIVKPFLGGTPLTAWVAAPIYAVGYAIVLFAFELARKQKHRRSLKK